MANIFLTRKCNLKCPYCFADEFVNKENEEITVENFKKALDFIKTSESERVGLIGGEPTLHPKFKEFLDILNDDEAVKNYVIFTNGLEADKYINDLCSEKAFMLINCNPPSDLGSRFNNLKNNIKLLSEIKKTQYSLGINLYSDKMDYSYIFDLLKMIGQHELRFSTALPNTSKENTDKPLDSFRMFKPFLFKFFKDCLDNEIVPHNDCNAIPNCLLSVEDKKVLLRLNLLAKKYEIQDTIRSGGTCSPVIDILPDLNAVRCFGLSTHLKVPIENFKSIENLRKYFYNKVDLYAKLAFEGQECEDCKSRLIDKCGLCFTYKIKKCEKMKKILQNV